MHRVSWFPISIMLWFLLKCSRGGQYISILNNKTSWREADGICRSCDGELLQWAESRLNLNLSLELDGKSFWIQNYEIDDYNDVGIAFQGCAVKNDIMNSYNTYRIRNNNLYFCKEICNGYTYFGIQNEMCICFDKENFEVHCVNSSDVNTTRLCGNTFSVYSIDRYCLLINFESNNFIQEALIIFRVLAPSKESHMCLDFMYYMNGPAILALHVYIRKTNDTLGRSSLWITEGNQGNVWKKGLVNFSWQGSLEIHFVGVISGFFRTFSNYFAIDNITITKGECKEGDQVLYCSFESDMCGWTEINDNELRWIQNTGNTPSDYTGPHSDRRSSDGKYIYVEGSFYDPSGKIALLHPIITWNRYQHYCLKFWRSMYGEDIEYLRVILQKNESEMEVWKDDTTKYGASWSEVDLDISSTSNMIISFEVKKKRDSKADVAIDDVCLRKGFCEDVFVINCEFENDFCGWENIGKKTWSYDEALEDLRFEMNQIGDHAVLSSITISENRSRWFCLKFSFYINDAVVLYAYIKYSNINIIRRVWLSEHKHTGRALDIQLSIFSATVFQVLFEVIQIEEYKSRGFIDDISLTIGRCGSESIGYVCPAIYFFENRHILLMEECEKLDVHSIICERDTEIGNVQTKGNCTYSYVGDLTTSTAATTTETTTEDNTSKASVEPPTERSLQTNTSELKNNGNLGLLIAIGILATLCAVVIVILALVCFRQQRQRRMPKQNISSKPESGISLSNINYNEHHTHTSSEAADQMKNKVSGKYAGKQTANMGPDYELSSPVSANNGKVGINNSKSGDSNPYQNEVFNGDDDYVYTDSKDEEYDNIGSTKNRRKLTTEAVDHTYAHALGKGKYDQNDYDTTAFHGSGSPHITSSAFSFENENMNRASDLYDHTA